MYYIISKEKLAEAIAENGFTLREAADWTSIKRHKLSKLLEHGGKVRFETFMRLVRGLGVHPSKLTVTTGDGATQTTAD